MRHLLDSNREYAIPVSLYVKAEAPWTDARARARFGQDLARSLQRKEPRQPVGVDVRGVDAEPGDEQGQHAEVVALQAFHRGGEERVLDAGRLLARLHSGSRYLVRFDAPRVEQP
jgi:hypothetical protein